MNENSANSGIENLAGKLHSTFVANRWAHAEQLEDGKYNTVYKPLGISQVHSMLLNGESCLTYQLSSGALRWVCFDVDIKREILGSTNYQSVKVACQSEVVKISSQLCDYLKSKGIPFLLEFSGNRGAHIWVLWKDFVDQSYGYALQQKILEASGVSSHCVYTTIDRFPQTARSQGKLGKGVKLPLSKHKKSGFYSCLVVDADGLTKCFNAPQANLGKQTIQQQTAILDSLILISWADIAKKFDLDAPKIEAISKTAAYTRQAATLRPGQVPTLESILGNLATCEILRPTIEKCLGNQQLSEKERAVMVGLLRRLQHADCPDFGRSLLLNLFSRQPNFKPNVTNSKLSNLHLYPPTCGYLAQAFASQTGACQAHSTCEVQKTPIELIEDCELEDEANFDLSTTRFEALRRACLRYAEINDEIDLYFLRKEMEQIDSEIAIRRLSKALVHQQTLGRYYKFDRPESPGRVRTLVSLAPYDAILSTWFTQILDGLYGSEVSMYSYGYRFESSLSGNNLFKPWFPQWIKYTKALSHYIEDGAFDDCWVVKIDIRSYYDNIPLSRLRVKLGGGPSVGCGVMIQSLDKESRAKYEVLCSTLVEWCRVTSGKDKGVPQGPAFARYLAELYLLQFDHDVEILMRTYQAHYFRWVDDIFLIAPDKGSAQAINLAVRSEIEALSLEVNDEKAFLGTIRDYRKRFHEYKNDSKYFVDQVARHSRSASSSRSAQARETLDELIEARGGMGIRPENASFFLTHLKSSHAEALPILTELLKLENGRGSFFRRLFDRFLDDWAASEYRVNAFDISHIEGFRLEVFLNCLLWKISELPLNLEGANNLSSGLLNLRSKPKSRLASALIIHLMLTDVRLSDGIELDEQTTVADLLQCLDLRRNSIIPDGLLNKVFDGLSSFPAAQALEALHTLMIENRLSTSGYGRASDKFFAVILEELNRNGQSNQSIRFLEESQKTSGELLRKYQTLCCLCSITGSPKNLQQLKRVWRALVIPVNDAELWQPSKPVWLEKADYIAVDQARITLLFAAGPGGDGLSQGLEDKHGVFNEYHYQLVVFFFSLSNRKFINSIPSRKQLIAEARNSNMLYLEWLLDETRRVELYPNKKLCLANIVENELMFFKRGSELLVRRPVLRVFTKLPSVPALLCSMSEEPRLPFVNDVYSIQDGATDLSTLMAGKTDLLGVIELVTGLYGALRDFSRTHLDTGGSVPNVFTDGFGIAPGLLPAVPMTALGSKLLIARESEIVTRGNNLATAWEVLLEMIEKSLHGLLPYGHHSQVMASQVRMLLPLGNDCERQAQFLDFFCKSLRGYNEFTAFDVDHAKFEAAGKYAQWTIAQSIHPSEKRSPTLVGMTLQVYLSVTGDTGEFVNRMSFDVVPSPSDGTLEQLLGAILESLAWTAPHTFLGRGGLGFLEQIEQEFLALAGVTMEPEHVSGASISQETRKCLQGAKKVRVEPGEDYELVVDGDVLIATTGEIVSPLPVYVCRFGEHSRVVEKLRVGHAPEIRKNLVYSIRMPERIFLYVADDVVRSVFEVIRKRSEAFRLQVERGIEPEKLECLNDRSSVVSVLRKSAFFSKATEVVRCNHFTSKHIRNIEDSERFLLRWLAQFELEEAAALLEVIAAHQCIRPEDIDKFLGHVLSYKTQAIIFSTKMLDDQGGVQRLFTLTEVGQNTIRSLALGDSAARIAKKMDNGGTLVVLAETILTGGQLTKNFQSHYLSAEDGNPDYIKGQRLFEIKGLKKDFVRGMKSFSKIVIIAAAHTQRGVERLQACLAKLLGLDLENIEVKGTRLIDSTCFLEESELVSLNSKRALRKLVADIPRIKTLFNLGNEALYIKSLEELDSANLIVRPNSVTKKGVKIFTLQPRNKYIPPLFRETKEHESTRQD